MTPITPEQVESLFGSDEAIGVTFCIDETNENISIAEYSRRYGALPNGDGPSAQSLMPGGGRLLLY